MMTYLEFIVTVGIVLGLALKTWQLYKEGKIFK